MTLPGSFPITVPEKSDTQLRLDAANLAVKYIDGGYSDDLSLLQVSDQIYRWLKTGNPSLDNTEEIREMVRFIVGEELRKTILHGVGE